MVRLVKIGAEPVSDGLEAHPYFVPTLWSRSPMISSIVIGFLVGCFATSAVLGKVFGTLGSRRDPGVRQRPVPQPPSTTG